MITLPNIIEMAYAMGSTPAGNIETSSWKPENFKGLINLSVQLLFVIGGLAFVIMFLIGALRYMTSAGDVKDVDAAKKTITASVIGVVLLTLVYAVAVFLNTVFGAPTFGGVISWVGSGGTGGPGDPPPGQGSALCKANTCPYSGGTGNNLCITDVFGCSLVSDPQQKGKCNRLSNILGGWNGNGHQFIENLCQNRGENKPVNFPVGDWGPYCSANGVCDCGTCEKP